MPFVSFVLINKSVLLYGFVLFIYLGHKMELSSGNINVV